MLMAYTTVAHSNMRERLQFLAQEFKVKVSDIKIVFGLTSIHKQFLISSPKRLPDVISRPKV